MTEQEIIEKKMIIEKLKCDMDTLKYFIDNSKIIKYTYNIIPILHEKHDFLFNIIKYGYNWKLHDLDRLCNKWIKYSEMITHDIQSIKYNKRNIKMLVHEKYTDDFNPYDMNREWFLPYDLLN